MAVLAPSSRPARASSVGGDWFHGPNSVGIRVRLEYGTEPWGFVVSEAKLNEVASGGELHFAIVIEAESRKEGAGTEPRSGDPFGAPRVRYLARHGNGALSDASSTTLGSSA